MIEDRFDDVIKPANDKRIYRGLTLKNGLKVLLISDNVTDKSAASINVGVGQMHEPRDIPGLAHFLEHMLFMGSEKYPVENEYFKYLSEHGGSSNAYTSEYATNYHFEIQPKFLSGALDRLSQFFISPLFAESTINREIRAVNSEYERNVPVDAWRIEQVKKTTSISDHDYNHFGVGNLETLEKVPKENGIKLRDRLIEFHNKEYSASIMSLVILGKENITELETMAVEMFSDVKNHHTAAKVYKNGPLGPKELKKLLRVVPIKDFRKLEVYFPVPDSTANYLSMPLSYISHLLGHEGYGSLHSLLRRNGLINSLAAGTHRFAPGIAEFFISIDLTEEAMNCIECIVTHIFQYIQMLKTNGVQRRIFDERKRMSRIEFNYKDKEDPRGYVTRLAPSLADYPFRDILRAESIQEEWKPELIKRYLKYLEPENTRILAVGKIYENKTHLKEKWFGTKYSVEDISDDYIQKWKKITLNSELTLPAQNEFIPNNLELLAKDKDLTEFPRIIYNSTISRVWFKQDDEYLLPKNTISMEMLSPISYSSPKYVCASDLFTNLFSDSLNEAAYPAMIGGLHWSVSSIKYGLLVTVTGYSEKLALLLKTVIDKLISFQVDPKRFAIFKDNTVRGLKNFKAEQPHTHAIFYLSSLLTEKAWNKNDLLDACKAVTVADVKEFMSELFSQVYIQALIHGNCDKRCANKIIDVIESPFRQLQPVLSQQLTPNRELILDEGTSYSFTTKHTSHDSSAVFVYYQTTLESTMHNAMNDLFAHIVSEPCFNVLRTQEQLGYAVHSGVRRHNGVQGLGFIVQSDRHPLFVDSRIEAFAKSLEHTLRNMTDEEFILYKMSLIANHLVKPKQMSRLTGKYFAEISGKYYNFNRPALESEAISRITKNDLMRFYKEFISADSQKRRKLAVHIVSDVVKPLKPDNITDTATAIEDFTIFKARHSLGPLPKPYINVPPVGVSSVL